MSSKKSDPKAKESTKATPKKPTKPPKKKATKVVASPKKKAKMSRTLKGASPLDAKHPTVDKVKALHPESRIVNAHAGEDVGATLFPSIDLNGHLVVNGNHFVTGDVKVSGAIRLFEGSCLFVAGDVYAQSFMGEGDFCCRNLIIEDTLYGSYESGMTTSQKASGKIWLVGNHDFEFGKEDFQEEYRLNDYKPDEKPKALPKKHSLSDEAIELLITRPKQYDEGIAKRGVSDDDWWKLLMSGGASKK